MDSTRIKTAKEFFDRIHRIELKEVYSESEINPLLKDLERLNHNEWNNLRFRIDNYWKYTTNARSGDDLLQRKICLNSLRSVFHRVLKDAKLDPLK